MQYLWAPWRMAYIMTAEKPSGCIFCLKAGEDRDAENSIVYRGRHVFVMLNAYPYNPGHLLIAPYTHTDRLDALPSETASEMMELTRLSLGILHEAMSPEGMNVGVNQGSAAGAGIADHIHQHVVPRWIGDTNFMTTVGSVKVLPEMIAETFGKLVPYFRGLDAR